MNWQYEYFVDSPGLAKASLNSGSGSALPVGHSIENLYSAAGGAQNSSSQALGSLLAEYTYSAYGDVLMKSGELADKNHVTYSTRYSEGNTGLIYYTYRHYAPRLHKWINKDPIAEEGGLNLYQMVGNDTVGNWDNLGYVASCTIDIFLGHGAVTKDGKPYDGDDVGKAISDAVKDARSKNISPNLYGVGGTSCYSSSINELAEEYGYSNPSRNNKTLRLDISVYESSDWFANYTSGVFFGLFDRDFVRQAEKEIESAKKSAKEKCNLPPQCCKSFTINLKPVGTDSDKFKRGVKFLTDELTINCE